MISTSTKNKLISLSDIKSRIQSIIKNILTLEELQNAQDTTAEVEHKHQLMNETNTLFSDMEMQMPRQKLLKRIKKRRNKRLCQKKKKNKIRSVQRISVSKVRKKENTSQPAADTAEATVIETNTTTAVVVAVPNIDTPSITEVFHQQPTVENKFLQLKNYNNAHRFLKTFELLEMLHYARSQDKILTLQFHEKFANLRCVWNNILMENKSKRTAACRIEDQWNETFFGFKEQTYYGAANKKSERERLREFLRIRRTWDSYLVRHKKHGNCIPAGWVLPKPDATEMWAKYRTTQ